jgi:hypothetical protein
MLLSMIASVPSIDLDDPNSVSPGILGFIAFFALAVALYLLLRNMNSHLRRMGYRAEADAKKAAALQAEADAAKPPEPTDQPSAES